MKSKQKLTTLIIRIMVIAMLATFYPAQSLASQQVEGIESNLGTGATPEQQAIPIDKKDIGREIPLASGVGVVLKEVHLIPAESGQIIYLNLELSNQSDSPFNFYPYWLRVQSTVGERFKVQLVDEQKSYYIYPGSSRSFAYYAEVPHQFTASDLNIQLIKWDFSTTNYEQLLHIFDLPEQLETDVVAVGEQGRIEIQGVPISVEISSARAIEGALRKTGHFTIRLLNQGVRSVNLPAFEYFLQGEGFTYPAELAHGNQEKLMLLPHVEKTINLRVPMAVDSHLEHYRLVMAEPKQDAEPSFAVPLTSFALALPDTKAGGLSVGEPTTIMYGAHDFELKVENIQLLPTTNLENMLSYDLYLTNKTNSRVALPELVSYVHVQHESPVLAIQKKEDKQELFPEEEIKLTMFATLPDRANLNDLSITFESKLGDHPDADVDAFEEVYAAYHVSVNQLKREGTLAREAHHFSNLGDRSTIQVQQSTTYETNYSKLVVSQFIVENKEQKPIRVPEYKGYFKSASGAIFPAHYKGKAGEIINPNGSAVLTYWAEVGKDVDLKEMQLVLGIPIDEESEAITEATRFQVIGTSDPVRRSTAYPLQYRISGMRASAALREELRRTSLDDDPYGLGYFREVGSVSLEYTLRKDYQPNVLADGYERTLSFELLDSNGYVRDRLENVSLDKNIISGKNSLSLSANVPLYEVPSLRIRVYENFEHGRQLIGTYSIGM